MIPTSELVAFCHQLADASGAVLRRHFRRALTVESKRDLSPVTAADRETEAALRGAIEKRFPEHGVRGEELGSVRLDAEYVWILDPIDGTRSFIVGKPQFVTLVGLVHRGTAILGLIDQPITNERWIGGDGVPTTLNKNAVRVRTNVGLDDAALFTTGPAYGSHPTWATQPERDALRKLMDAVGQRQYSADGYAFGLLAGGWIDLVAEAAMEPHDFCAAIPVVRGAGGVITDWDGAPLDCSRKSNVLAAGSAALHTAALQRLKR